MKLVLVSFTLFYSTSYMCYMCISIVSHFTASNVCTGYMCFVKL